jgi:hypothetical protein
MPLPARALVGALLVVSLLLPASGAVAQASPCSGQPVANDGQCLAGQSPDARAAYTLAWGDGAAQQWVAEHNASLPSQPATPPPPAAPAQAAAPVPAPTMNPLAQQSGGLPIVGIEQPCANEDIGTGIVSFTIVGFAFDPLAPPGMGSGIRRVNVSISSTDMGSVNTTDDDPHVGAVYGSQWQKGSRWKLTFNPVIFQPGVAYLTATAYSAATGQYGRAYQTFNIAQGQGLLLSSC